MATTLFGAFKFHYRSESRYCNPYPGHENRTAAATNRRGLLSAADAASGSVSFDARFGIPGKTMVASDSHTPAAGSLGMLAIGVGGIGMVLALAGEPLHIRMPEIWGVHLTGQLPPWTSAKTSCSRCCAVTASRAG